MSQPGSGCVTIEQLGIVIACAEHGSFSAEARRLQRTWRLGDLSIEHVLLRADDGWGHVPEPLVERELAQGFLKRLVVEHELMVQPELEMRTLFRKDAPPGRLATAFIEQVRTAVGKRDAWVTGLSRAR